MPVKLWEVLLQILQVIGGLAGNETRYTTLQEAMRDDYVRW